MQNAKMKNFLAYFLLAVAVVMVIGMKIFAVAIMTILGGLAVSSVIAWVLAATLPIFKDENVADESGAPAQTNNQEKAATAKSVTSEFLLKKTVTLLLECKIGNVPRIVLSELEEMIDNLFEILPRLNEMHSGTELAYVVNKISGEYLHELLNTFIGLSSESRSVQEKELVNILQGLNKEIREIKEIVESQKVGDFRTHARFIKAKFFGETIEAQ